MVDSLWSVEDVFASVDKQSMNDCIVRPAGQRQLDARLSGLPVIHLKYFDFS